MLADCFTKTMASGRLSETMSTGIFDMRPTEESLAKKSKRQEVERASKKEQERPQDSDS